MKSYHDVVIVGAGGSGLSCAIKLHDLGVTDVVVLSKVDALGSHTSAAKGGINAALGNITNDDWRWHAHDTLKAACGIANDEAVQVMCQNAPSEIEWLSKIGVEFDKLLNGKISQRKYGGQKTHFGDGDFAYRACHVSDRTGKEIMNKLYIKFNQKNLKIYNYTFAFQIHKSAEDEISSIICLDLATGNFITFFAKVFIIATGGYSQVYKTNSSSSLFTGDGHILALQAGAKLKDLEFVQFHPTGLAGSGLLLSEAARGEGGYLLNDRGERFMSKYSSDFMELSARDVIARAIFIESENGKRPVYLSIKHLPRDLISTKLSDAVQTAINFAKVDPFLQDIPVFPTAHYNMGGVEVDQNYRAINLENCYTIGEVACAGIHGANRLGCNSLLELFTSAHLASSDIKTRISDAKFHADDFVIPEIICDDYTMFSVDKLYDIFCEIQLIMDTSCGVVRNKSDMESALQRLCNIGETFKNNGKVQKKVRAFDNHFVLFYETKHILILAILTIESAIFRSESIGAHFIGVDKKIKTLD